MTYLAQLDVRSVVEHYAVVWTPANHSLVASGVALMAPEVMLVPQVLALVVVATVAMAVAVLEVAVVGSFAAVVRIVLLAVVAFVAVVVVAVI